MSGSQESLLSRLYAAAREHWSHCDYYSYSVYFLHNTTHLLNMNTLFRPN